VLGGVVAHDQTELLGAHLLVNDGAVDILMVTHRRPAYTRLALDRLLETCDESMHVWLWHNGDDPETLDLARSYASHPRVGRFHHCPENARLREPTNWLWSESSAPYVSKVDDDCLMPDGWAQTLRRAHEDVPELGVVGCWRFQDEDFVPELAEPRIRELAGGHRVLRNLWVEGSGYLMKRACIDQLGLLSPGTSFPTYCKRLARAGWLNGWYFPFLRQEHMDDPRSPHCLLDDEALAQGSSLTAAERGITTVDDRVRQIHDFAVHCQSASLDPADFVGWRAGVRRLVWRGKRRVRLSVGLGPGPARP
jgi:hypothetical protein